MDAIGYVTIDLDALVAWTGLLRTFDGAFRCDVSSLRISVFVFPLALEVIDMSVNVLLLLASGKLAVLDIFFLVHDDFRGFFLVISVGHVGSLTCFDEVALIK